MSPSRGLLRLLVRPHTNVRPLHRRVYSNFAQLVATSQRKSQVYISRSLDPYVNLSIEHFLLQKTPADSTVLFLYTNKPCIVIGRNQNPWVEVNLGLLGKSTNGHDEAEIGEVDLVRRRSGGGTVFHDEGNVNYSVICPTAVFDRDRHAEMVVRALRQLGVTKARVNERHDIVLGTNKEAKEAQDSADGRPLKVSGSAYKLTRLRSLHHGTCLLSSPNIKRISLYLRSPAKPFIKARGVDSVSSPIANVNVQSEAFEEAVVSEFSKMYDSDDPVFLTGEESQIPQISQGLAELRSPEWTYLQTPQFTFSSHATQDDPRARPELPDTLPEDFHMSFTARNGAITDADLKVHNNDSVANSTSQLLEKPLHTVQDWQALLPDESQRGVVSWLNKLFGSTSPRRS